MRPTKRRPFRLGPDEERAAPESFRGSYGSWFDEDDRTKGLCIVAAIGVLGTCFAALFPWSILVTDMGGPISRNAWATYPVAILAFLAAWIIIVALLLRFRGISARWLSVFGIVQAIVSVQAGQAIPAQGEQMWFSHLDAGSAPNWLALVGVLAAVFAATIRRSEPPRTSIPDG